MILFKIVSTDKLIILLVHNNFLKLVKSLIAWIFAFDCQFRASTPMVASCSVASATRQPCRSVNPVPSRSASSASAAWRRWAACGTWAASSARRAGARSTTRTTLPSRDARSVSPATSATCTAPRRRVAPAPVRPASRAELLAERDKYSVFVPIFYVIRTY